MEKFFLRSLLSLSIIFLAACSSPTESENTDGIDANSIVSGTFSNYDNLSVTGTGHLLFNETLVNSSSRAIAIKASLENTPNSMVGAVFYTSDSSLNGSDGISVRFFRTGASVDTYVGYNNISYLVQSANMAYYFPTALDVIIEVHNVSALSQARVLVWRRDMVSYAVATADIDTNRPNDLVGTPGNVKGSGGYVGLYVQYATVTNARIINQKVLD